MKMKSIMCASALAVAAMTLSAAETVDLVSAKATKATAWVTFESPGEGTLSASAELADGFTPRLQVVVKELRDPNAFFTDLPGIGDKVPVGVGLADGAKGVAAKKGESVTVRVVVPVDAQATSGVHRGTLTVTAGGAKLTRELNLRVLDYTLPPVKSRYSGRPWVVHDEGPLPADWTVETPETYAKDSASVSSVVGSLWKTKDDLQPERWRTLGVPYYALLDIPYVVNPDAWRRAAGTKAWQLGFDGVALPPAAKLDPVVRAGLEDAAIDVAYLSYASELANGLADKRRHPVKITYEGRLGQFWVDRVNVAADDMDVVRLETQARIVRLLAFVKKEVSK